MYMEWGLDQSSGTLEMTVQREQFLSTNLENATGLVEPGGNAPGKLPTQFSYSLLCLESFNKCFAMLRFNISILSQTNRREQGRAPGKSGRKIFKVPSTSV